MTKYILLVAIVFISFNSKAQNPADTTFLEADTSETKIALLPDRMGPIKRAFWGKHGLLRITHISPLTPEGREKEMRIRRRMLLLHQAMGFVTLACMLTADFSGQMVLNGKDKYHGLHSAATSATIGTYFMTAGFAVLAPPPLIARKKEWDAMKVHKTLALLHFTGMVLTPILAPDGDSAADLKKNARFHQISAYTTTVLFASAIIVVKF